MPHVVELDRVDFWYAEQRPLLKQASLTLGRGVVGLVGPNGAGKSSLLGLLSGRLAPVSGRVSAPPSASVALCSQRVDVAAPALLRFAEAEDALAHAWRGRLALEPEALLRWANLSPGERRRWQLAAALASQPELLLLDEPTGHLDAEARDLIISALRGYRGALVLVSHDRELLDGLTSRTLWLAEGELTAFDGGYSRAREVREERAHAALEQRAQLRSARKHLKRRMLDERQRTLQADLSISARTRMKGTRDNDARSALAKGRAEHAAAKHSQRSSTTRLRLAAVERTLKQTHVTRGFGRSLFVDYTEAPARLTSLVLPTLRVGEKVLARDVSLVLSRESRVWLSGPSGCGKSTLLEALLASIRFPAAQVLHLPQDLPAERAAAQAAAVRTLPPAERARVYELVAALGTDPEQLIGTALPSPGEAHKLELALGLSRDAWLVALDEPTNHLDLPSVERLQAALASYPGALVLVTHDAPFAQALCHERWELVAGRVRSSGVG